MHIFGWPTPPPRIWIWIRIRIKILSWIQIRIKTGGGGCTWRGGGGCAYILCIPPGYAPVQEGKNYPKNRKKRNFKFLSAGCSLLIAEGFSGGLDVLYGGLGITANFDIKKTCFFSAVGYGSAFKPMRIRNTVINAKKYPPSWYWWPWCPGWRRPWARPGWCPGCPRECPPSGPRGRAAASAGSPAAAT